MQIGSIFESIEKVSGCRCTCDRGRRADGNRRQDRIAVLVDANLLLRVHQRTIDHFLKIISN